MATRPAGATSANAVVNAKLAGYGLLSGLGLFVGLAAHSSVAVLLGAPFAIALCAGLAGLRRPRLTLGAELSEERVLEGDGLTLRWRLEGDRALGRVQLFAALPLGLEALEDNVARGDLEVRNAGSSTTSVELRARRWGRWPIERIAVRVLDAGRFVFFEDVVEAGIAVNVHPTTEHLREIVDPAKTAMSTGSHRSRLAGEGIEFAEVRPYSPGDHLRQVNWRATARHGGELWVNKQHVERNADVVLLVDTRSDAALGPAVRVASSLATAYADSRDRIGVVGFGGTLRWVEPGSGLRHLYRVLDALLLTKSAFSYVWADPTVVPRRTLPPGALVFAITPLDDHRSFETLRALRGRGVDLVVLEVATPLLSIPGRSATEQLAHRLWLLHRKTQRGELRELGVPVVAWDDDRQLSEVFAELRTIRQRQRRRVG